MRTFYKGSMETKQLGNSDMRLTRIGLGTWAIGGGDTPFSWGAQDDSDSIAAIHRALDLGVNWIDTAPVYGLGHSEEIVGRALKGTSHKPYVFTKCAMVWNEKREIANDMTQIRREIDESLRRLQVDAIDLYQIHWPKPDEQIEEAWGVLADLKRAGKVRWIGVSNFNVAQMERAMKIAPITSLQPPYSMINRTVEAEILPFCRKQGIGVINYSPMHSGLLTGAMTKERVAGFPQDDFRRRAKNYQEPHLSRNLGIAEFLKGIAARHGVPVGVIAIAWTLHNPAVTAAIVGGRSAKQVEGVAPALEFKISDAEYTEILDYLDGHPAHD
ncbi:oxidoreductase [Edaphobacter acidisoli]|uniref:Oxidoreductase n=2 Tax=Edaphobacter acidisoli TaxID=2040573 RepID=A0A916W8M2_9BACT|nr:oxidoreductase [Edaphobacter acidisoli]